MDKKAVVITTKQRGVFFGYVEDDSELPKEVTLSSARMCIYWSSDTRGVMGLAATGPLADSRVTPKIPEFTCYEVTGVLKCEPEAVKQWEEGSWSS